MTIEAYKAGATTFDNIYIEYFITGERNINKHSGYFEWGIKVIKYLSGKIEETEEIPNISPDYNKVLGMAEILIRNKVTPVGVRYAIEDMII